MPKVGIPTLETGDRREIEVAYFGCQRRAVRLDCSAVSAGPGQCGLLQVSQAWQLIDGRRPVQFSMLKHRAEFQRHCLRWFPKSRQSEAIGLAAIDSVHMGYVIVDIAWVAAGESAYEDGERVAERNIHRRSHTVSFPVAAMDAVYVGLNSGAHAVGRGINRHKLDQTADATSAVEGSLGSAQQLDARQITRVDVGHFIA